MRETGGIVDPDAFKSQLTLVSDAIPQAKQLLLCGVVDTGPYFARSSRFLQEKLRCLDVPVNSCEF